MGVFDKASLALVPDGIKDGKLYSIKPTDGSGDFTFTRGSNLAATRVDENGLIEKGRENLATNTNWEGASLNTAPTDYAGYLLYNGTFNTTSTEGQIRFTTDSSSRAILITSNIIETGIFTQSVYVDEVYTSLPVIHIINRSSSATAIGYYEDGVEITATTEVQAGKRYSIVWNKTGAATFRFGSGVNSQMVGDIVLSRPQIERGLVATEHITSPIGSTGLAGILENLPRIDYTGSTPSLLLEPSRTNFIPNSEYITELLSGNRTTITDLQGTSPEGKFNAAKLIPSTDAEATHQTDGKAGVLTNSYVSGDKLTISVFAKADGYDGIILRFKNSGCFTSNRIAAFDLSRGRWENISMDGTIGVMTGEVGMENYGNGWYRCYATATADATGIPALRFPVVDVTSQDTYDETFTGDDIKAIQVYGFQLEQGSYPTSYIPTYGTAATRGEDNANQSSSYSFGSRAFSLFFEHEPIPTGSNGQVLLLSVNPLDFYFRYTNDNLINIWNQDIQQAILNTNIGRNANHKICMVYDGVGSTDVYIDGVKKRDGYSFTWPDGPYKIVLNPTSIVAGDIPIHISQVMTFETALTNEEAIALTTV